MSNPFDLLVEVFAAASETAESFGFGTGYPVARSRIITAGHVLKHGTSYIQVRLKQSNLGDALIPVDGVTWDGRSDGFDVAILACSKLPADLFGEIPLLETMPISDAAANGMGYPLKSRTEDQSRPASISGKIRPMPSRLNDYELACDDRMGNDGYEWTPAHWTGVSGSPMFVDGKLAGVIIHYRDTHSNDHFRVVAICRLLRNKDFRAAIGRLDPFGEDHPATVREACKEALKRLIDKRIRSHDDQRERTVLQCLALELELNHQNSEDRFVEEISGFVVQPRDDTIADLVCVHEQLSDQNKPEEASRIAEIIDLVLPLHFPRDVISKAWQQLQDHEAVLIESSVATKTAAEIVMAGVARRSTAFSRQPLSGAGMQDPVGENLVPLEPPAIGDPEQLLEDTLIDLHRASGFSLAGDPRTGDQGDREKRIERIVQDLNGRYRALTKLRKRPPYCALALPVSPLDRAHEKQTIARIRKLIPHLLFIGLDRDSATREFENFVITCLNTRFASELKRKMP